MFNAVSYQTAVNLFHLVVVVPLLIALATDNFPQDYKIWVVYLALLVAVFHLYRLVGNWIKPSIKEGMAVDNLDGHIVHYIKIFDSSPGYDQPLLKIKQGEIVVWRNIGELQHSVTAKQDEFNSGYMRAGETYAIQFNNPGTYYYYDMNNRGWMIGVIIVE